MTNVLTYHACDKECVRAACVMSSQPMPYPPWRRDLPGLMVGAPRERLRPLLPPFFEAGAARSSSFASSFACVSTRGALAAASHAALRPALAAARDLAQASKGSLGLPQASTPPRQPDAADPAGPEE